MTSKENLQAYLLEALRQDLVSYEAELNALHSSLRFYVGGILLEAFPLRLRSIVVLFKLILFYFRRTATLRAKSAFRGAPSELDQHARRASVIVFGRELPQSFREADTWYTQSAELAIRRLDFSDRAGTLLLRVPDQQILRRLERARREGWRVIWDPEADADEANPALAAYARAHVDECREAGII